MDYPSRRNGENFSRRSTGPVQIPATSRDPFCTPGVDRGADHEQLPSGCLTYVGIDNWDVAFGLNCTLRLTKTNCNKTIGTVRSGRRYHNQRTSRRVHR